MSVADFFLGVAQQAARASVEVKSNLTPPVSVPLYSDGSRGATDGHGAADFLLRAIKPSIRVQSAFGDMAFAPWGDPDPDAFKGALIVASAFGVLFVGLAVLGLIHIAEGK